MFLKNKNIIFKIRRSKVTDYAALKEYFQALEMDKMHIYVVFPYKRHFNDVIFFF